MKEILKNLVESTTLPEDAYLDQDAEILEIFVEELEEIFEDLDSALQIWKENTSDHVALTTIRRHFHTLKGSGRMVGAKTAGEIAWAVEDVLNRVLTGTLPIHLNIINFVEAVFKLFKFKLYALFKHSQPMTLDLRPLVLIGEVLQQQSSLEPILVDVLCVICSLQNENGITGLESEIETEIIVDLDHATSISSQEKMPEHEVSTEGKQVVPHVPVTKEKKIRQKKPAPAIESMDFLVETVEIFIEEAAEHLAVIDAFIINHDIQEQDYNNLIRAIHTLRGSSSMAHLNHVFDASSKVEQIFKQILEDNVEPTARENTILVQYAEFIRDYLHTLLLGNIDQLIALYQSFISFWEQSGFDDLVAEKHEEVQGLVSKLVDLKIDQLLDAEFEFAQFAQAQYPIYIELLRDQAKILLEGTLQYRAAEGIHILTSGLYDAYQALINQPELLQSNSIYYLFNQLHQQLINLFDVFASGQRASLSIEAEQQLYDLTIYIQDFSGIEEAEPQIEPSEDQLLSETLNVNADTVFEYHIEASSNIVITPSETIHKVRPGSIDFAALSQRIALDLQYVEAEASHQEFDEDLLDIFLEEADELLLEIDRDVNIWSENQQDKEILNNLMRYLHTLKGGANMISATHVGLIAHHLETIYEKIIHQQLMVSDELIHIIRLVQDNISDRIQLIRNEKIDSPANEVIKILDQIGEISQGTVTIELLEVPSNRPIENQYPVEDDTLINIKSSTIFADSKAIDQDGSSEQVEDELQLIVEQSFLEEAQEILETSSLLIHQWFDKRSDRSILLQLQRAAHSLKGGARMTADEKVAEISYQLETAFEQFAFYKFNSNVYDALLLTTLTWLNKAIFNHDYTNYDELNHTLKTIQYVDISIQLPESIAPTHILNELSTLEFIEGDGVEPPAMYGVWEQTGDVDHSNEMIRISADLVEKMIDLAGENSITRSSVEVELAQLGGTLNEMELTIKRLADQLRRMEGELESQIIAKHDSENSRYIDFDPLEMDEYSSLNQLSKSLAESASDLIDFKNTLTDKIRDTENLLLQQSRIQTEMQESLIRTRLVPFASVLPRLQRLVRQTASALNRPTELVVQNTEGELDRTILERLVTPLEHMLRNAIDHGIEDKAQRLALNKPELGSISLSVVRQGTDIIVIFKDDGNGIDVQKIREKALSLGLMQAEQHIQDKEVLQFIFHPGFSTAKEVTQISGRGVGLDVVQSEIKAVGGYVEVESSFGFGTTFTIRVPTTVAISDALMVQVGDQQFALPLAQIDRIVRIPSEVLEGYFNSKDELFEIDQMHYKLRYLSEFIGNQSMPRLAKVNHSLPVILVKTGMGQTVALLVDQLIGSRNQIVVKPIGQQFAQINSIVGATILGDGQVCLILDSQSIARQILASKRQEVKDQVSDLGRYDHLRQLVMIVDDSVTVRKVTSRLLERQGYSVVTAKDGLDAIEQLENVKPDLMLLDIEMPRMDGFEVTNHVRHHELHKNMPIIMITSRTGEKHRERAFNLGVTHYMGKPFQEAVLLESIESLLALGVS